MKFLWLIMSGLVIMFGMNCQISFAEQVSGSAPNEPSGFSDKSSYGLSPSKISVVLEDASFRADDLALVQKNMATKRFERGTLQVGYKQEYSFIAFSKTRNPEEIGTLEYLFDLLPGDNEKINVSFQLNLADKNNHVFHDQFSMTGDFEVFDMGPAGVSVDLEKRFKGYGAQILSLYPDRKMMPKTAENMMLGLLIQISQAQGEWVRELQHFRSEFSGKRFDEISPIPERHLVLSITTRGGDKTDTLSKSKDPAKSNTIQEEFEKFPKIPMEVVRNVSANQKIENDNRRRS